MIDVINNLDLQIVQDPLFAVNYLELAAWREAVDVRVAVVSDEKLCPVASVCRWHLNNWSERD